MRWAGDLRYSFACAALLLGLLLVIDAGNDTLTAVRAVLWAGLSLLLFLVLLPPRVAAGGNWVEVRGVWRTRRARTDRLASVACSDGVAQRLVLRDADGGAVEVEPRVLLANPRLWHLLDTGVRTSEAHGTLRSGGPELRRLAGRIDAETARAVFRVSGLDD
ncbi:hypothetical protein J4032_11625 [Streptomyces formicae]|uniref:Integral membrane protein n=1 Tax=Streptomyces formicae TaxID=1616117 RepID=A0ABY3X0X3_9ACTN|nr:hypothetical protein J4032_11625 [Streptomyces formicae]